MLNLLVDKAIERTRNKPDSQKPIFTISYSSINKKPKSLDSKELESKTVVNKISKISGKHNNFFQKWKSKTLQKLQDLNPSPKNSFFLPQSSKNLSFKLKSSPRCPNIQSRSQKLNSEMNSLETSYIVHQNKVKSKAYSFQQSPKKQNKSQMKSVYLQYKDENKQKKKKIITLSNFYQKKLIQNRIMKTVESSNIKKSQNSDHEEESRMTMPKKNMSFFNTIQYKTVPKEEIRYYKNDQLEHSKKQILSKGEKTFERTVKDPTKIDQKIFERAKTNLRGGKQQCEVKKEESKESRKHSSCQTVNIRKVHTEKRSRKLMGEMVEDLQILRVNINNCRPWSPVKTNSLFIGEDLLFEQSRTFDVFSTLEEINQDRL